MEACSECSTLGTDLLNTHVVVAWGGDGMGFGQIRCRKVGQGADSGSPVIGWEGFLVVWCGGVVGWVADGNVKTG